MRPRSFTIRGWPRFHILSGIAIFVTFVVVRLRYLVLYNDPSQPQVSTTFFAFLALADALDHGQFGMVDIARLTEYGAHAPFGDYRNFTPTQPSQYVPYYTIDIGYMFLVYLAQKLFPFLAHNYLPPLLLQIMADGLLCAALYIGFLSWSRGAALAAGLLHASSTPAAYLSARVFYYYWDLPITLLVLACFYWCVASLKSERRPAGTLAALLLFSILGFAVWMRSTWWLLAALTTGLLLTQVRRRHWSVLLVGLAVFVVVAGPQVYRASTARGHFALSTRASWHVALVGLGAFPNPYGIDDGDNWAFELSRQKHGIAFVYNDYSRHDAAVMRDYVDILRSDPVFVIGSWVRRMADGLTGHRVRTRGWPLALVLGLGVLGAIALLRAGGERRALAIAAVAFYTTATAVTSAVYYVKNNYFGVQLGVLTVLAIAGVLYLWREVRTCRSEAGAFEDSRLRGWRVVGIAVPRGRAWAASSVVVVVAAAVLLYGAAVGRDRPVPVQRVVQELPRETVESLIVEFRRLSPVQQRAYLDHIRRHRDASSPSDDETALRAVLPRVFRVIIRDEGDHRQHIILARIAAQGLARALRDVERFVDPWEIKAISGLRLDDRRYWDGTTVTVQPYQVRPPGELLKAAVVYVDWRADPQSGAHQRSAKIKRYEELARRGAAPLSLAAVEKFENHGFAWGGFASDDAVHMFHFQPR